MAGTPQPGSDCSNSGGSAQPFYDDYTPHYALREVRQGQGTFRVEVTEAYHRQSAVSREHSLSLLEAAHIVGWSDTHINDVTNGILLRADIHKLSDAGYVTSTLMTIGLWSASASKRTTTTARNTISSMVRGSCC